MTAHLSTLVVSEHLDLHPNTVRELVSRGALPAYRIGNRLRFDPADVEAFLASRRTAPEPDAT